MVSWAISQNILPPWGTVYILPLAWGPGTGVLDHDDGGVPVCLGWTGAGGFAAGIGSTAVGLTGPGTTGTAWPAGGPSVMGTIGFSGTLDFGSTPTGTRGVS